MAAPRSPMSSRSSTALQKTGSLVAVEGDIQTVATQLRLLPPSSKILVLPPLLDDVASRVEDAPFNARSFVRDVHAAFSTRAETARSFLKSATSEQPRLVFMNGGSVCAKTTCIANICENVTNGEIREAEALFGEIVKDGVAGLLRLDPVEEAGRESAIQNKDGQIKEEEEPDAEHVRSPSDAGSAAMKAADDLDRDTAELQPSNDEEVADEAMTDATEAHADETAEETAEPTARDAEVGEKSESKDAVPEETSETQSPKRITKIDRNLFTNEHGEAIKQTIISLPTRPPQPVEDEEESSGKGFSPRTPHTAISTYADAVSHHESLNTSHDDVLSTSPGDPQQSVPVTPGVEYGEACIVDVQSANIGKKIRRVQSVDRIYGRQTSDAPESPVGVRHTTSYQELRKRSMDNDARPTSRESFETLPRSTFMKASKTTIKRSPTLRKASIFAIPPRIYLDRGTDAEIIKIEELAVAEPFEPVFPVIEDLVIHFANNNVNEIFDSVVRSYKDGSYPVFPVKQDVAPEQTESSPKPVNDEEIQPQSRPFSHVTAETDDDGYQRGQEVDPYNPDSYPAGPQVWAQQRRTKNIATIRAEPPTPATTPPPVMSEVAQKFHEFVPVNANSAVGVQNSLRSVLNLHFGPAETTKFRQYDVPLECDRLWKPVFRNDNGQSNDGRTVDQILAIGCEDGVSSDFFNDISGQIEKLGTKKSGISRTGKLDIRYLIAIAMQSHTMLPLTAQSASNPFGNPLTLATSIVPQLETYLSMNSSIRLLILTYPASHLSTIISLRKLLGSDILKVSGIIDALASDPPSFAGRASPPPPLNLLSNEGAASLNNRHKPAISIGSFARTRAELARQASAAHAYSISNASSKRSSTQVDPSFSFAKANFLLPSTATDAEISTFLSSIWKTLIEKSNWYTPEPPTPSVSVTNAASPNLPLPPPIPPTPANQTAENAPRSPLPGSSFSHKSGRKSIGGKSSKIDQILGNSSSTRSNVSVGEGSGSRAPAERPTGTANSLAPSTRTTDTTYSEKERREEKAWENFQISPEGESDDEIDRMLMPRLPKKQERKKGNSRKALKWLGLA